jgi:thioredoxin-related protein
MQSILSIAILFLIFTAIQALRGISHFKTSVFRQSLMELMDQKGIVTMYKKEGCPYCKSAKELLENTYELEIKYVDIESAQR